MEPVVSITQRRLSGANHSGVSTVCSSSGGRFSFFMVLHPKLVITKAKRTISEIATVIPRFHFVLIKDDPPEFGLPRIHWIGDLG